MITDLPAEVNLLTLKPIGDKEYLIRIEHIYQKSELPVDAQLIFMDLMSLFPQFNITSVHPYLGVEAGWEC